MILIIISFHLISCSSKKDENGILLKKIEVRNELCENCIGLRSINIVYFFETKHLLKEIYLSVNDTESFQLKRFKYKVNDNKNYCYEYVFDNFDLSKHTSLSDVKSDFKKIIYFKKLRIINTSFSFITDSRRAGVR